jgi:hypothetical protein
MPRDHIQLSGYIDISWPLYSCDYWCSHEV